MRGPFFHEGQLHKSIYYVLEFEESDKQGLNITPFRIFGMLPRQVSAGIPASEEYLRSAENHVIPLSKAVITPISFVISQKSCHSWIFTQEDPIKRSYLFEYVEGFC
jgi:hypothetical protein